VLSLWHVFFIFAFLSFGSKPPTRFGYECKFHPPFHQPTGLPLFNPLKCLPTPSPRRFAPEMLPDLPFVAHILYSPGFPSELFRFGVSLFLLHPHYRELLFLSPGASLEPYSCLAPFLYILKKFLNLKLVLATPLYLIVTAGCTSCQSPIRLQGFPSVIEG